MLRVIVSATLLGIMYSFVLSMQSVDAVIELGQVKCMLFVNFSKEFHEAHRTCWSKLEKERGEEKKEAKANPYPVNATVEEFEWDDKCMEHCIFKTAGILGKDEELPDVKDTEQLFGKGKVSKELYEAITSEWNKCLELSGKVGKEKKFDKCKMVTFHRNCFSHKMVESMEKHEISC